MQVLIHHGDTVLGRALDEALREAGHDVWLEAAPDTVTLDRIVIGCADPLVPAPAADGLDASLAALIDDTETGLGGFMALLQAAARRLMRQEDSQIWVLTHDGGMRHCMPLALPGGEPLNRAKQAAVKSLAKELHRFGIHVNCANVQTLKSQQPDAHWQGAREALKAYAMRFRPIEAQPVAKLLCGLLQQADLPLSGVVLPIGIGLQENNL